MFFHCFLKSGWICIENTLGHILKCGKLNEENEGVDRMGKLTKQGPSEGRKDDARSTGQ